MTKVFKTNHHQIFDRIAVSKEDSGSTNAQLSLNIEELAWLEVGETPTIKEESLFRLRQLLQGEPTLKIPPGDYFLLMFLRARKYRVEDAFKMVKNYFLMRRDMPEFFDGLVLEKVPFRTICHEHKLLMIPPERDKYGRYVGIFKIGAWSPDVCSLVDFARAVLLLTGSWQLEDLPTICGVVCVLDMKGLNIRHLRHLTPSFLWKIAHITQDCWPARIKAVYIVNHPRVFELIFAAIKPFLRNKLLSRVHFIGLEDSEFWDKFPRDVVPSEHGGRRQHFDYDRQEQFVRSKNTFFESLCACGYERR